MRIKIALILIGVMIDSAMAEEYDFYLHLDECKTVVSYLVISKPSLKVFPGDPVTLGCKRASNMIVCDLTFNADPKQKGRRGNKERYEVSIDSPPLFHLKSGNGAEYIAIDTVQHVATLTSRVIDEKFVGAKVCRGVYITDFEMRNIEKK